ncbi:DNA primase [Pontibacter qinzhouensis]|uniref:DNA primase n=1 Tax=Pontibacter qinzhouensis TaxID=2603253 RepID=A0A5C8K8F7_9BACT|nr:toprim domain-containing protein [Pontibacter qinzhouensis]TXK45373.1 DNA primase [Pontibacter qinzhouensis]
MNIQQINSGLAITDFLASQGFRPAYTRGADWWYISPIRPAERTPSFKVSTRLNRWYDHGAGEGGKLFDLALRLCGNGEVKETIRLLSEEFFFSQANPAIRKEPVPPPDVPGTWKHSLRKDAVQKETVTPPGTSSGIRILETQPLRRGSGLAAYLRGRGIRHGTAKDYCREVRFALGEKEHRAVGFANCSGGYELRNAWFKGSSSPKDITFLDKGGKSVCLLEGFLDFLSLLELKHRLQPSSNFIILNSVALAARSLELLEKHREVYLFLDRDEAGRRLTERLLQYHTKAIDASSFYQSHQDVNDYLLARQQRAKRQRRRPGL